jgi:hypothetical protein
MGIGVKSFIGSSLLSKFRSGKTSEVSGAVTRTEDVVLPAMTESVNLSENARPGLLSPKEASADGSQVKNEATPTLVETKQDAFTTALQGSTIERRTNDVLVDFGPEPQGVSTEDLRPAFLSLLSSDSQVADVATAASPLPPADPSGILEPAPIVGLGGYDYHPNVELRVYSEDTSGIAAPEFVKRGEGAISALEAFIDGREVKGRLNSRKIGGPFVEAVRYRIQGLDGESVILECNSDPGEYLPEEVEVLKVGSKSDEIELRPEHSNGLYRMNRQDFAKHLDSVTVLRPKKEAGSSSPVSQGKAEFFTGAF